ncbi:hypothetical protein [Oceanobacillus salinisoli]|uniref:hypothetical protein n=1 Tax=Oceanobacillus salinisoli TaxID=2678611 RepID=UPI0012E2D7C2|nr:hypothetical protein [Oceanobacillus salinisoli]
MSERLERMKQYYSAIDCLEPDLQEDIPWLIQQAERAEKLQEELNAKIMFVSNGMEEEHYALQEENIRLAKRVEELEEEVEGRKNHEAETARNLNILRSQNQLYKQALEEIDEQPALKTKLSSTGDWEYDYEGLVEILKRKAREALKGESE